MATTVSGTFHEPAAAQMAVEKLIEAGVQPADISLVALEPERVVTPVAVERHEASGTAAGIVTGGALGAIGGLLLGLGSLAVPGIGPILVAGPLVAALGGTAIGAATGGLVGALVDLGVPEEHATVYVTEVERGSTLVTAHTSGALHARVRAIMAQTGARHIYASPDPV